MNHQKAYSICFLIMVTCFLEGYGRINAQELISTAGNSHNNTNGSISYTIGEPVTETFAGTNQILTQGFHQSDLIITAINEVPGLNFEISAFPNPAAEFVKLKIGMEDIAGMQYMLYDLNGKLLLNKKIEDTETEINFNKMAAASYILRVTCNDKEVKSFKIVKINQ